MVQSCTPTAADGKVVLVTGAAGFVGFHTARRLQARGDAVLGLDNFNHYYDVSLKLERERLLRAQGISQRTPPTLDRWCFAMSGHAREGSLIACKAQPALASRIGSCVDRQQRPTLWPKRSKGNPVDV